MASTRCFLLDLLKSIKISHTGSPNKIRQKIIHKQSQEGRGEGVQFIIYWVYTQSLKLIFFIKGLGLCLFRGGGGGKKLHVVFKIGLKVF